MEKNIFYTPDIKTSLELPHDEALHCIKVLRKKEGDEILLTDGKGFFYNATIVQADIKHCIVEITNTIPHNKGWKGNIHIAFAPTKNMDRNEWFAEKATEIGIDRITPIICDHSERKDIKPERLQKILVSAMKQSQKASLPQLDEPTSFTNFIKENFLGQKFIAHCYNSEKTTLNQSFQKGKDVVILIGPEGDFSEQEINIAIQKGFNPISLGKSRLRTETAALIACHTIHILNQE